MSTEPTTTLNKLDELIFVVTQRNKEVQTQKQSGSLGWIVAGILGLLNFINICLAMWYASKRSKELADFATAQEQRDVDIAQQSYETAREPEILKREALEKEWQYQRALYEHNQKLLLEVQTYLDDRLLKLKNLKSWKAINDA